MTTKRKDRDYTPDYERQNKFYLEKSAEFTKYFDLLDIEKVKDDELTHYEAMLSNTTDKLNKIIKFILDNIIIILKNYLHLFKAHIEKLKIILSIINFNFQRLIQLIYYTNTNKYGLETLRDRLYKHYKKSGEDLDIIFKTVFKKNTILEHELYIIFDNIIKYMRDYQHVRIQGTGKKNKIIRKTKRKNKLKERLKEFLKKSLKRKKLIN